MRQTSLFDKDPGMRHRLYSWDIVRWRIQVEMPLWEDHLRRLWLTDKNRFITWTRRFREK